MVKINEVSNFQSANTNDINIVFSTIQGLYSALDNPRENSLTEDDFRDIKLVLISDEAHHINVDTRQGRGLGSEDLPEVRSWEGAVEKIFRANSNNILVEFTATVDFEDENLAKKYLPRLIFDYPLKEFRKDGYSKEVKVLQADLPSFERALQAILLSQYRQKLFESHRKQVKPVVLFKSKKIEESKAFAAEFSERLRKLEVAELEALKAKTSDPVLVRMFNYFDEKKISLENLIGELQDSFSDEKLLTVNSGEEIEDKQIAINTLEDINNQYRAIFAVNMLNEGWDVLNLFDIVRLYDSRDSRSNKVGTTTMSEAQLIGRGARYCPFLIDDSQLKSQRKYDEDLGNELRVCEELYYHSLYNPKYIQELTMALKEIGIIAKSTLQKELSLKDSFKANNLYKVGHIFLNSRVKYSRDDIDSLDVSLISQRHKVELESGFSKSTSVFDDDIKLAIGVEKKSKDYQLIDFGIPIIIKAIHRIDFYRFSNLKKFLPKLTSINELVTSPKYLGLVKLEIVGLKNEVENLSVNQKLKIATEILLKLSSIISSDKIEFKGTREFTPHMIKSVFTDKTLNFSLDEDSDKQFSKSMINLAEATSTYHLDLSSRDWYVYNDCYGTSEEKLLIKFIDKKYDDLKRKYSDAFLIRNERHFQLYSFSDGRPLEPDFVLYLVGKDDVDTLHYQVFIEPKGGHLLKADEWKEQFLIELHQTSRIEQLFENKKYIVWGMPFFNSEQRTAEFEESFDELIRQ